MSRVIALVLKQRMLAVTLLVVLLAGGVAGFRALDIEAYPDPAPPLVEVVTRSAGRPAAEIERYITNPIEGQLASLPHVSAIQAISLLGLSDVKVQFTDHLTNRQAEQKVINQLSQLGPLPNGAQPAVSPASPSGEIFRYGVIGPPGYSATDLQTLEDWVLERRFKAVPGVIDVAGWGGSSKTFDVTVDLHKLETYGLALPQVIQALGSNDASAGGQTVDFGAQSAVVQDFGRVRPMAEIRNTKLIANNGTPVLLSDIATVTVGRQPRLGIAGQDDDDVVQGIVLMRRDERSLPTIDRVEAEMEKINTTGILPPGVHIERIDDRSDLIGVTTDSEQVRASLALGVVGGMLLAGILILTTLPVLVDLFSPRGKTVPEDLAPEAAE